MGWRLEELTIILSGLVLSLSRVAVTTVIHSALSFTPRVGEDRRKFRDQSPELLSICIATEKRKQFISLSGD